MQPLTLPERIYLVGFMGTGKTTVGRLLAAQLHYAFLDTDMWIEQQTHQSVAQLIQQEGETTFRDWEKKAIDTFQQSPSVIACGGGLFAQPGMAAILKKLGYVICLTAQPKTLLQRLRHGPTRPLLQMDDLESSIQDLLKKRKPFYDLAHQIVATDGLEPDMIAHQLKSLFFN